MKRAGGYNIIDRAMIGCTYGVLAFVFLGIFALPFVIISGWENALYGLLVLAGTAALVGLIGAFAIRDRPTPPGPAAPPATHGSAHWATVEEAQQFAVRREEQQP